MSIDEIFQHIQQIIRGRPAPIIKLREEASLLHPGHEDEAIKRAIERALADKKRNPSGQVFEKEISMELYNEVVDNVLARLKNADEDGVIHYDELTRLVSTMSESQGGDQFIIKSAIVRWTSEFLVKAPIAEVSTAIIKEMEKIGTRRQENLWERKGKRGSQDPTER